MKFRYKFPDPTFYQRRQAVLRTFQKAKEWADTAPEGLYLEWSMNSHTWRMVQEVISSEEIPSYLKVIIIDDELELSKAHERAIHKEEFPL